MSPVTAQNTNRGNAPAEQRDQTSDVSEVTFTFSLRHEFQRSLHQAAPLARVAGNPEPSPEHDPLVKQALALFNRTVTQQLAEHFPGKDQTWLAERVVEQAKTIAINHGRQDSNVTDADLRQAWGTIRPSINTGRIAPRDTPIAYDDRLSNTTPNVVVDAIIASVTDDAARETLQKFHEYLKKQFPDAADQKFVELIKPALTSDGHFRWSNSRTRDLGEKLQHELVHQLLTSGRIPQDCRPSNQDPNNPNAIGLELEQRRETSARAFADSKKADEAARAASLQRTADGYLTGASSEAERLQTKRAFKAAVNNPNTSPEYRAALEPALQREEERSPKPASVSTYIDSTNRVYTPNDIATAERFSPEVAKAMRANAPGAYELHRPPTQEEISELRAKLAPLKDSIATGIDRAEELASRLTETQASINGVAPQASQDLLTQDLQRVEEYKKWSGYLQGVVDKTSELCDRIEKTSPTDPDYAQLLAEFKEAQRDLLYAGGANDMRGKLGHELVAIKERYELVDKVLTSAGQLPPNLSTDQKQQCLTILEGVLTTNLRAGGEIQNVVTAIQTLSGGSPRQLLSYLYRLEAGGNHGLVQEFARQVGSNGELKDSLQTYLASKQRELSETQKKHVSAIQQALNSASRSASA